MKKEYQYFILFIFFFSLIFILCGFVKNKVYQEKEKIVYLMDEGLVAFHLQFDGDEPLVSAFELLDDKAKELYYGKNFIHQKLLNAIEACIKDASDNYSVKIHVWTNWDNVEYFNKSDYNLVVKLMDKKYLNDLKSTIKPVFLLDEKYYKVADEHRFSITFLDDGKLKYHVDTYEDAVCTEFLGENCKMTVVDDTYYEKYMSNHTYCLNGEKLSMYAEYGNYFRYKEAKHECIIGYNRIKCTYFNRSKDDEVSEIVEYYEI